MRLKIERYWLRIGLKGGSEAVVRLESHTYTQHTYSWCQDDTVGDFTPVKIQCTVWWGGKGFLPSSQSMEDRAKFALLSSSDSGTRYRVGL